MIEILEIFETRIRNPLLCIPTFMGTLMVVCILFLYSQNKQVFSKMEANSSISCIRGQGYNNSKQKDWADRKRQNLSLQCCPRQL